MIFDKESYDWGIRIGRLLALLNPDYYSRTDENGIVIIDKKGLFINSFSGPEHLEDCYFWLNDMLKKQGRSR